MPNTRLTKQQVTATDRKKFTFSFWFKRGMDAGETEFIYESVNDSSNRFYINLLEPSDTLEIINKNSGSNVLLLRTTRAFRDVSAWYHLVLAVDTDQSTAADRNKLYINGERITSFSTETNFSSGVTGAIGTSSFYHTIGGYSGGGAYYAGSMSFFALVDGTQELPTIFGETDSTTGQWKIKANITPSSGWGDNGFLILKNGNSLTDESTNSNNFALATGTLTATKDCPDNVFVTLNALAISSYNTLSQGNLTVAGTTAANDGKTYSTLVMPNATSKFYWEVKCVANEDTANPKYGFIQASRGFDTSNGTAGTGGTINPSYDVMVRPDGKLIVNDATTGVIIGTWGAGDILSFALDSINGAFYVGINGVWQTSGNPASGASRTGAIKTWSPTQGGSIGALDGQAVCLNSYNTGSVSNANFGNGYFGTSAVSSAGTNASDNGIFEYDVPTGFTALSTKGLNL